MVNQTTPTLAMSPKTTNAIVQQQLHQPRFKIYFQDDAVRQRSQHTVQQLLVSASSEASDATTITNSALLAKKALKYRKVYERMTGVDVTSPGFDASKFLGLDWCKTQSLKAHCARQQ